jgi:V/A-type H+-transporting ATPase subunit E
LTETEETAVSGINKIIEAIESEAKQKADAITAESDRRAEKIRADGNKAAEEAYRRYLADCRKECAREYENACSAAEAAVRRKLLVCRSELIDRAQSAAAERIAAMSDSEYFELILRLASKSTRPADGTVSFNAADLKRMPADFEKRLNDGASGGRLKISDVPADIDGGFIISFGDITENCSISAVMEAERDTARDAAAAVLFARGDGE